MCLGSIGDIILSHLNSSLAKKYFLLVLQDMAFCVEYKGTEAVFLSRYLIVYQNTIAHTCEFFSISLSMKWDDVR